MDTVSVPKTKAPLEVGDIVRFWGKKVKKADAIEKKGRYGVVVQIDGEIVKIAAKYAKVIDFNASIEDGVI